MNELWATIQNYIAIWAPSLVAILGIVGTIITSITKLKREIEILKGADYQKKLEKSNEEVREQLRQQQVEIAAQVEHITSECRQLISDNKDLKRVNRELMVELTRIKKGGRNDV